MNNIFKITLPDNSVIDYNYDGAIFPLCNKLQELQAKSLTVPIAKKKAEGCMPPNVLNDIKTNTKTFKGFSLNQSDSLKWQSSKGVFGGSDYNEKYNLLLKGKHTDAMLLVNNIHAKINELNQLVKKLVPGAKHQANFYVTWK